MIAQSYFDDKIVSTTEVVRWEGFLRSLVSLNPRIAFVYLPTAPTFVVAGQPYAHEIRQNLEIFDHLSKSHGIRLIDMTVAQCVLGDDKYADPVHVNRGGRKRYQNASLERCNMNSPTRSDTSLKNAA